jgi:hypothetical protein
LHTRIMALNMDDLIGSMQHGFHAGDRGNDINEIRESLKLSLGQQHPQPAAGPSNPAHPYNFARRHPASSASPSNPALAPPPSSLDADVAMLSSSSNYSHHPATSSGMGGYGQPTYFGGPGSWGSQSSVASSSSNFGAPGTGWGYAPAPANTPQQTPVETSALARQLQAELERQNAHATSPPTQQSSNAYPIHSTAATASLSPQLGANPALSPPQSPPQQHPHAGAAQQQGAPRSYVNGFHTHPDADGSPRTPTAASAQPGMRAGSFSP